jgi:hypothetical protein
MPPGSPKRAPVKRDASFPEPSFHYLSQFPVNVPPPQVPQWDPYGEGHLSTEPSASHPLKIHLSLRVPSKGSPPCSPTGSLWRGILCLQSHWSIHLCLPESPKKESYKMWKNIRSLSTEPHADRRPIYNGVQPGSPRGSLTTLAVCTPVPCSPWHDTFHLGLGRPEPL